LTSGNINRLCLSNKLQVLPNIGSKIMTETQEKGIFDDRDKSVGEEYIDEWKNPKTGAVTFYCSLCGCQFDNKLIVMHSKGLGHKIQYQAFKEHETVEDRLVHAKHLQISLTKDEFEGVQDIVLDCEKALKLVSDIFAKSDAHGPKTAIETFKAAAEKKEVEAPRRLTGVMRCGLLSAGLLMTGEINVELIVLTADKPTTALLQRVAEELPKQLATLSKKQYEVVTDVDEAGLMVTSVKEPKASCQITLTSPLMRTHPFRYYNEIAPADPVDVLPREKCEEALRRMRRARWFEAKVYPLSYCDLVIRIFRDLSLRVPTWNPFQLWTLEVMVQKCLSCADSNTSSPARAVQSVFECLSSGILLQDSPGLYDPCEREPTDLCQLISLQERECITTSAQHALRLIAFGQMHRILGMSESALVTAKQGGVTSKRKRTFSDEYGTEGKKLSMDDDQ